MHNKEARVMRLFKQAAAGAAAVLACGCASTSEAPKAAPAPAPVAKPAEAPKAPAAAVPAPAVDKTPIKADLSKVKFSGEPEGNFGWDDGESRAFYYSNGSGEVVLKVPADGDYEVTVSASCQKGNNAFAKFDLEVDGQKKAGDVTLTSEDCKEYSCTVSLKAGERKLGVRFTNDMYKENEYDLNFYLHGVKLVRVK
jgi:hypothetical protein